jgi:hypothetical protein
MSTWRVRLSGLLVLLAGLVGAVVVAPPVPAAAAVALPPGAVGPFQIRSVYNHRCLDEPWRAGGAPNGTQLQLWDCLGGSQINQHWYLVLDRRAAQHNLGRRYLLVNGHSGRCVDAIWDGPNFQPVVAWDCYTNFQNPNQLWHVWNADSPNPGPVANLNGRILDAHLGHIASNGTPIMLWDNWGGANQSWYLVYNF